MEQSQQKVNSVWTCAILIPVCICLFNNTQYVISNLFESVLKDFCQTSDHCINIKKILLLANQDFHSIKQSAMPNWEILCSSMTSTCSTTYRTGTAFLFISSVNVWIMLCKKKKSIEKASESFFFFTRFHQISGRREVYRILQEEGIDLPRYAVLNRDPDKPDGE